MLNLGNLKCYIEYISKQNGFWGGRFETKYSLSTANYTLSFVSIYPKPIAHFRGIKILTHCVLILGRKWSKEGKTAHYIQPKQSADYLCTWGGGVMVMSSRVNILPYFYYAKARSRVVLEGKIESESFTGSIQNQVNFEPYLYLEIIKQVLGKA